MKSLFFFLVLVVTASGSFAQSLVKGQLKDTAKNQQLDYATVSLINGKDSSLFAFTRTDSSGSFQFKNVPAGKYRLSATHTGFHPTWLSFEVKDKDVSNLGEISMTDNSVLKEVVINAEAPPVSVKGDTLEFNAASFKTKTNAVVEDLLKKMPGVVVDRDGTVRVNGQRINKVLVNGKEFFTGDPKLATRNLAADAVDKVQVFEKQSDQAEFTGMRDGNSETAINLKLKKDKSKAVFGRMNAGLGNQLRYDGQFNLNKFDGEKQISSLGMANNTNRQGFSLIDVLNFTGEANRMMRGGGGSRIVLNTGGGTDFGVPVQGGDQSPGISRTIAGGVNFNNTWNKKTQVNGSYFYNNIDNSAQQSIDRSYVLPGSSYRNVREALSQRLNESNRINLSVDHKIDSFNSLKITPSFTRQNTSTFNNSFYQSVGENGQMLNDGYNLSSVEAAGTNFTSNLLYRHRFQKKGRTISANLSMSYNNTKSDGRQGSYNNFYSSGAPSFIDTVNQVNQLQSITQGYSSSLNYTEPLWKKTMLELNSFYNLNLGSLDRKTYDFNSANGKYDKMNAVQSNAFTSEYKYTGGGANFRLQEKKFGFSVGANFQHAALLSKLVDSNFHVKQQFNSILPLANFNYSISRSQTLRLDYSTSTRQPNTSQLQPVRDISDPLNIREGNPSLKQEYTQSLNLQFFSSNQLMQRNLMAFISFSNTSNAIVNSETVDNNGVRTSRPVNASSVYNLFGTLNTGFTLKKLKTRIEIGGNVFRGQNKNFINRKENLINSTAYAPRMSLSYSYKEMFDITATARWSYNVVSYSAFPMLNNKYWQKEFNVEANANLPKGFSLNTELTNITNTGRAQGFNQNNTIWNASIAKSLLKAKRGELKFSVNDILNENVGISRNVNQGFVEDVRVTTLKRYFLVGFTYNLNRPAGNGGMRAVMRTF
jgi:hypothetical protein